MGKNFCDQGGDKIIIYSQRNTPHLCVLGQMEGDIQMQILMVFCESGEGKQF